MLDTLITSKTRVKLLLKFFSNSANSSYLRELAQEFGESTNSVRIELNKMIDAGFLESSPAGNTIRYKANKKNPLFTDIQNMVKKYLGFDRILENVIKRLGNLELAMVVGNYAKGQDSGIIDLVLVGDIDYPYLMQLVQKTEGMIERKLRPLVLSSTEYEKLKDQWLDESYIILWNKTK